MFTGYCNLGDIVARYIFLFGIWEPNISTTMEEILSSGDIFVDIGANIGYYTLLASRCVGDGGKVVSIEAVPAIFDSLKKNVSANECKNVRLVNCAVASTAGELPIYGSPKVNRGMSSLINHRGWPVEAVVTTAPLEHILTQEEIQRVKVIKIDIEGAEIPVLDHFIETLHMYPPDVQLFVELSPYISGDYSSDMFDKMLKSGFDAYLLENEYGTDWYLRWHLKPAVQIGKLPPFQADILFRRRSPAVQ